MYEASVSSCTWHHRNGSAAIILSNQPGAECWPFRELEHFGPRIQQHHLFERDVSASGDTLYLIDIGSVKVSDDREACTMEMTRA
ncbi:hypothetical protein [Acidisphaera sp. L21]|uniref:hypothetical protein n=1 Tax=Acidisphaera sp. L21 TaxID=1641851 RepID=UPI001C2019AE|nr:hypothetical protein [Acidisphaera sp. L21]